MRFAAAGCAAVFAAALSGAAVAWSGSTPVLRDMAGNQHRFDAFQDAHTAAVVYVFLDDQCPDANRYLSTLRELHDRYNSFPTDRRGTPIRRGPRGEWQPYDWPGDPVQFLGIYSRAPFLSIREIARHALQNSLPFRVLQDPSQALAEKFGVSNFTEVRVWDPRQQGVVYAGPIDDQYQRGRAKVQAENTYLRDVLDQMVSGEQLEPTTRLTNSGCPIPELSQVRYEPFTYYEDVEPIIQEKCQPCHRPHAAGPIDLLTLQDVQDHAGIIEQLVHDRTMPPFPGDSPLALANDRRLTDDQWYTLISWFRGGRRLGDRARRTESPAWPDRGGWEIGEPDFIARMETPFICPQDGVVDYVYVPIQIPREVLDRYGQDETLYIQAIETKPGEHPQVMHHIQVHEYHGKIEHADRADGGGAVQGLNALDLLFLYGPSILGAKRLGGYEPGDPDNARVFEDQVGMALEGNIIVELHLTPDGRSEYPIQVEVGFIFSRQKPRRLIETNYFYTKRGNFIVPANLKNHSIQGFFPFQKHIRIESIRGHCHYAGTKMRLEKIGKRDVAIDDLENRQLHLQQRGETLLEIPSWDFNWQVTYKFQEPLIILNDEAVLGTAFWDNTVHNQRRVRQQVADIAWGQQVFHEMFNVLFLYEELDDNDPLVIEAKRRRQECRQE